MGKRGRFVVLHGVYALLFLNPLLFSYRFQSFLSIKEFFSFSLLAILLLIWGISRAVSGDAPFRRAQLTKPLAVFLIPVVLAATVSPARHSALAQLWKVLLLVMSYFLFADLARDSLVRKRMLTMIALSGVVAAVIGLGQRAGLLEWSILGVSQAYQMMYSTFGNVSGLAGYLLLAMPVLWGLFLAESRWWGMKFLWATGIIISFIAILACETRGVWVSLVLTLSLFVFLTVKFVPKAARSRERWPATIIGVMCAAGLLLVLVSPSITASGSGLPQRIAASFDLSQPGVAMRARTWLVSLDMIKAKPVQGHGLGSFAYLYPERQAEYFAKQQEPKPYAPNPLETESAHNDYLQLLVEMGILGLLGAVILLWSLIRETVRSMRLRGNTAEGFIDSGAFCSIVAMLLYAATSFPFRIISDVLVFVAAVATLCPLVSISERQPALGNGNTVRAVVSVVAFLVLGVAVAERIIREYAADYFLTQAQILEVRGEPPQSVHKALHKAMRFDPHNSQLWAESGRICLELGRAAEGIELLQDSLRERQSPWVHLALARALELNGNVSLSAEHYNKAEYLAVGDPQIKSEARFALMRLRAQPYRAGSERKISHGDEEEG